MGDDAGEDKNSWWQSTMSVIGGWWTTTSTNKTNAQMNQANLDTVKTVFGWIAALVAMAVVVKAIFSRK